MEKKWRNYEEFAAHIRAETEKARQEAAERVADSNQISVGCIDALTEKLAWNPPGGLVFLYNEGLLGDYIANRAGKKGELAAHWRCGYMRVVMNLEMRAEHKTTIEQAILEVERLNLTCGANFRVTVEPQGSAAVYMKG